MLVKFAWIYFHENKDGQVFRQDAFCKGLVLHLNSDAIMQFGFTRFFGCNVIEKGKHFVYNQCRSKKSGGAAERKRLRLYESSCAVNKG